MPRTDETPLAAVSADPELIRKLGELWISSAEQVVAAAATPGGIDSLAQGLKTGIDEVEALVAASRDALSPSKVAELETPVDASEFGTGALPPDEGDEE